MQPEERIAWRTYASAAMNRLIQMNVDAYGKTPDPGTVNELRRVENYEDICRLSGDIADEMVSREREKYGDFE